jgi:hypothetical protein
VLRVFVDLMARSLRGRLVQRLRQLKSPRYLIGFLLGMLYFGWFFTQSFGRGGDGRVEVRGGGALRPAELLEGTGLASAVEITLALVLAAVATVIWWFKSREPRLPLAEAELHLLLPAPLTRGQILGFSLAKDQLGILFSVAVLSALGVRSAAHLVLVPTLWITFTLLGLHFRGVSFWKARTTEIAERDPRRALTRRGLVWAGVVAFWGVVGVALERTVSEIVADLRSATAGAAETEILDLVGQALGRFSDSAGGLALAPLRWLVRPFLEGTGAPLWTWLFAVGLLLAHAVYLLRSPVRFEEVSLSHAREARKLKGLGPKARRRALRRSRQRQTVDARRKVPFPLLPAGRPELAVTWKNLLLFGRFRLAQVGRTALVTLGVLAALTAWLTRAEALEAAAATVVTVEIILGLMLFAALPFLAGLLLRQDLRSDLLQIEALRTWPLTGRQLVLAEVATPVLVATAAAAFGLCLAAVPLFVAPSFGDQAFADLAEQRLLFVVAGLAALPAVAAVAALSSLLQNLAALVFPSWMPLGDQIHQSGPAAVGQNMLLFLGHGLGMAIGLLGPALGVGLVLGIQVLAGWSPSLWQAPLLLLLGTAVLALELVPLVLLAGRTWDRLDPSEELLAGG